MAKSCNSEIHDFALKIFLTIWDTGFFQMIISREQNTVKAINLDQKNSVGLFYCMVRITQNGQKLSYMTLPWKGSIGRVKFFLELNPNVTAYLYRTLTATSNRINNVTTELLRSNRWTCCPLPHAARQSLRSCTLFNRVCVAVDGALGF